MPLAGNQLEELTDLIKEAFNPDSLTELVRFKLGADMYKDLVPPGKPFRQSVFLLLTALVELGSLVNLIDAVLAARPDRQDIQEKLPGFRAALDDHTAPASTQVATVTQGVASVGAGMAVPGVRKIVTDSGDVLLKLADDISLLKAYKALHDGLHLLQYQLRSLATSGRTLLTDPMAVISLGEVIVQLRTLTMQIESSIGDLPSVPPAVRRVEKEWNARLQAAVDLAQKAADDTDPVLGRQSSQEVRSILRQEPPRIDRVLNLTAESLELARLKAVFAEASQPGLDQDIAASLLRGQNAVEQIIRQLQSLINLHSQWQSIDGALWEAEDNLPKSSASDPSDFDALWAGITRRVGVLTAIEPASPWALTLTALSQKVAACRKDEEWGKLTAQFVRFRQESIVQFFSVDTSLKNLAGQVSEIGASLRDLINDL